MAGNIMFPPGLLVKGLEMEDQIETAVADAVMVGHWITPDDAGDLPNLKGAYVLALRLKEPVYVKILRQEGVQVMPGWYFYIGSARGSGGIRSRVRRHFRPKKKAHWHIDQLTSKAAEITALAVHDGDECDLVDKLLRSRSFKIAIPGFGSTDCRSCESHLLVRSLS